jgi:hypothetical protein
LHEETDCIDRGVLARLIDEAAKAGGPSLK